MAGGVERDLRALIHTGPVLLLEAFGLAMILTLAIDTGLVVSAVSRDRHGRMR